MYLTAPKTINTAIYIENLYQGKLAAKDNDLVNAISWHNWFQTWLSSLQSELVLANGYEISLRLTGDRQIQLFNSQYRSQDRPTDVLAFAAIEANIPLPQEIDEPLYLGDIVISLDTAVKQAQKHSLNVELAWLASHGLLHLIGWDHPDEASLAKMLAKQADLLALIGIK